MNIVKKQTKFNDTKPFERDHFIDLLKGICILFILIHHLFYFCGDLLPHTAKSGWQLGFQYYIFQAVPILLIISGYVWTLSYERNKFTKFYEPYKPINLLKKFIRLFVPYLVAFIIILSVAKATGEFKDYNWWKGFWTGGPIGYGGYYVPIMVTLILFLPICWIIVKKWGFKGFVGLYGFNILFEVFRWAINMDIWVYELVIFRYTGLIAYGVYLVYHKDDKQKLVWSIAAFVLGVTYLSILYYTDYKPIVLYADNWRWSNMMTFPYIIPIVGFLIRHCHIKHKQFGYLGEASYSFFLSQNIILLFYKFFTFNNDWHIQFWIGLSFIVLIGTSYYLIVEYLGCKNLNKLINHINHKYSNKQTKK